MIEPAQSTIIAPHLTYFSDLALCDFGLFPKWKIQVRH